MNSHEVMETCRKLKPIIGSKADRLWHLYLSEDEKGRKDIALQIEILAEKLLRKEPLQADKILLRPPSPLQAEGGFLLGDIVYNDKRLHKLHLCEADIIKQVGIFSITGEGKTNVALLLALQLLRKGIPFLIVDWKRTWRSILSLSDIYPELKDIQIYTVGREICPFHWNPFRAPPNIHHKSWIYVVTEVLEKSHLAGQGVADLFLKIYEKLFREFGFKNGNGNKIFPNFYDGVHELSKLKVFARELLWKQSAGRVLKSFTFGPGSKAFNSRQPLKLEELLQKPVILELDQELSKPLRTFFTELILRFIHLYRLSQGETDAIRHVLFLEEVHNLFPRLRYDQDTNSSLESVYREIRAFGQGLVSITQHPSLLPIYLLGNCHTQIFLGLQHEKDVRAARESLFIKPEEENYLDKLNVGEGIVKVKGRINPCLVKFPLVPVVKGLITDDSLRLRQGLSALSRPETPLKPIIKDFPSMANKDNSLLKLLEDIKGFPLAVLSERYKRLGLSMRKGNDFKNNAVLSGLVISRRITTRKTQIILLDLTEKAKAILRQSGHEIADITEGVEHKYWKSIISDYYRKKGFCVSVEEIVNGRADIIVEKNNNRTAIEIETGNSDAVSNIRKNLKAGFNKVITAATNRAVQDKIKSQIKDDFLDRDDRISLILVQDYDID